jgi:hypothetical protein
MKMNCEMRTWICFTTSNKCQRWLNKMSTCTLIKKRALWNSSLRKKTRMGNLLFKTKNGSRTIQKTVLPQK